MAVKVDVANADRLQELHDIIPVYFANKAESKSYDALAKRDGDKIKALMTELDTDTVKVGKYTASITHVDKSTMDEAKLLELVKADFPEEVRGKIIKTYEYVDKNALEEAMYRGEVGDVPWGSQ